eukprot:gene12293-25854_t
MSASFDSKKKDKRKEHINRILSSKEAEKFKNRFLQDPEFLCVPVFQNSAPPVPLGPFFKICNLSRPVSDFAAYKETSLERNFVWQPHGISDLTLKLDLVDQDAILVPEKSNGFGSPDGRLNPSLHISSLERGSRGASRTAGFENKKFSWLKRTTYLTNDVGDSNANKND